LRTYNLSVKGYLNSKRILSSLINVEAGISVEGVPKIENPQMWRG
jgi:hypothetical protein